MTRENNLHWHYLLDSERRSSQTIEHADHRSDSLTQSLQGYKYSLKNASAQYGYTLVHAHTHYNIPSVTSEQWHITPAPVFKFSDGAAAGGDGAVSPPDATHVILTCHPCQLHFNTLGRIWAEKQKSSWQTASSDPTFTANLPVKSCDTPAKYWDNVKDLLTCRMCSSFRQWCRLLQENMSSDWPLHPESNRQQSGEKNEPFLRNVLKFG